MLGLGLGLEGAGLGLVTAGLDYNTASLTPDKELNILIY